MHKFTRLLFLILLISVSSVAQTIPKGINWKVKPFEFNVFIENAGQFSSEEQKEVGSKILYYSRKGSMHLYFTPNALIYRYDSIYRGESVEANDKDEPENLKIAHKFLKMEWEGANPNAFVEVIDPVTNYFTYGNPNDKTGSSGIKARAWSKLIYHNIYKGIDVIFLFPEKGGIEYTVIVNPGADLSKFKVRYSDNVKTRLVGNNIIISSPFAQYTDHAPTAVTEYADNSSVPVSFVIKDNTIGFKTADYDKSQPLIIDPWISSPLFASANKAFDLDIDLKGNIYLYGSTHPYLIDKFNSLGVLQWTYTSTFAYTYSANFSFYGDMCVDGHSGSSFISEGFDNSLGSHLIKVNTNGIQVATNNGSGNFQEIWRMEYNNCEQKGVMLGGGTSPNTMQVALLDTTLATLNPTQMLVISHMDYSMLALDNIGNCFALDDADDLIKSSIANFPLNLFNVPSGYTFGELAQPRYIPNNGGAGGNGFNGLVTSPNFLYSYDGAVLKKWNLVTGANLGSVTVFNQSYKAGGLTVTDCDNIFLGVKDSAAQYDVTLHRVNSYLLPDSVYDMKLGANNVLYACGKGFLCSVNTGLPSPLNTVFTAPSSCGACDGSATANVVCGAGPYNYLWSNGKTTSTITGLCAGIYTVNVSGLSCGNDTAVANIPGKPGYTAAVIDSNPGCALYRGNITAYPTGGTAPYTYAWSNGETNQKDTGLVAGTYTCVITDAGGCKYTLSVTLVNPTTPTISVSPQNDTICKGSNIVVTASGAKTYSWTPATGLSCNNCPNPTASPTVTTTYTVNAADSNGCTGSSTVTVAVRPIPAVSINPPKDTICQGNGVTLVASGATTYHWSPSNGLSCINCPNPLASPTVTTLYTVVGTDTHGCTDTAKINLVVNPVPTATITVKPANDTICRGDSALLKVTGGCTYKWTFNNSTSDSIYVKPLSNNTYFVQVSCNGCSIFVNKLVNVIGSFVANVTGKDSVCAGDSALWTASGGATYKWLPPLSTNSPTVYVKNNITYSCVITSTCGTDTIKRAMHVLSVPVIGFIGDTAICSGKNASFNASGGGSYTWTPPASGLSCYNCPNPTATPATSTTYTLTIANGMCSHDTIIHLSVNKPTDSINHPPRTCLGTCVTLNAFGGGTYQWSNGATTSSIQVCPTSDTTVKVKIMSHGCPITDSTVVNVSAPGFKTSGDDTIELGDTAHLHATGAQGYIWSPATGLSCTTCPNPVADPSVTTTYTIISTDSIGCTSSKTLTVYVETPCADFNVPNVFTPNDDGINDDFVVKVLNPSSYSIIIYDRWGKQMYRSTDATVYWNGRINGTQNLAPDGVYYYIIKATCASNDYTKKGFVQLIGEK